MFETYWFLQGGAIVLRAGLTLARKIGGIIALSYYMSGLRRPLKFVLYGRVSSSGQSQECVDDQLDAIKRFIDEKRLPRKVAAVAIEGAEGT